MVECFLKSLRYSGLVIKIVDDLRYTRKGKGVMMRKLTFATILLSFFMLSGCKISGKISTEDGIGIEGITVSLSGNFSKVTTTNSFGYYEFSHFTIFNNTYTITPFLETYLFDPEDLSVEVNLRDVGNVDFTLLNACFETVECTIGYFCLKNSGECENFGQCSEKPSACPDVWDPVCGCDGTTYGNACEAAAIGVNVDYSGECVTTCTNNSVCTVGDYCAKSEGDCGGMGYCSPMPSACPDVWDPVCGCDGTTYGNACEAARSGVNVSYLGSCL